MIGQSDFRPQQFTVNELANGMAEILIYENIVEFESVDFEQNAKTMYDFDMHEIMIPQRSGLADDIEANYQEWLNFAKGQTTKPLSDKEKIVEMEAKVNQSQIENVEIMTMLVEGGII